MLDEESGFVDKTISVRQILKSNRVDLSWMELCAWSPQICREIKRLLTRMSKKRTKKSTSADTAPPETQVPNPFSFQIPQYGQISNTFNIPPPIPGQNSVIPAHFQILFTQSTAIAVSDTQDPSTQIHQITINRHTKFLNTLTN